MKVGPALALLLWFVSRTLFLAGQVQTNSSGKAAPLDYSKEAFVIEKVHTTISVEADGTNNRLHQAEIKILADAGVKAFAVLNFTYTSANESVEIEYVRVRKPDGTVVKTPDYNVQDMPADVTRTAPLYSDIHEKHVAVKGLAVGDVLEYRIHYRVLKPEVPGHFWFEDTFSRDAIVKDERLEISVPSGKYLKVVSPDFKPETREEGGRRSYIWNYSNLVRREKDPAEIPKRTQPNPSVQVTTFSSWEEVGRWYAGLQKDPLEVTPAIQAKAAELTKGLQTEEEKVRAIYNFVSLKFHYVGLDFGVGRYQPHAADDVLGNGYGDCKDKHTLFASLLKAAGYDAWPALIHASRKLDPEVPSPAQFNHVITVVPIGDHYVWLDTTPEVAPYGLLLPMLRDKQALVVPSTRPSMLMTAPKDTPFPQEQAFSTEGKLDAEGTYTAHIEQTYRGDVEIALRSGLRQVAESQWKEAVQRYSYALGFAGDVSNVNMTPVDDTTKPLHITYDYVRKNYGEWENGRITLPFPPIGVESNKDTKKPKEAVFLGALGEVVYKTRMTLPSGYTASLPKSVDLIRPYADYHSAVRLENGVLIGERRLVIKKTEVALDDWENYRDFGKAISDDESTYIYVNGEKAGANASPANVGDLDSKFRDAFEAQKQRDFTRAAELYREVLAGYPKYQGAHLNLGIVDAAQGKVDEAIEEFRKEEEANPQDARAYEMAAGFLMMTQRPEEAIKEFHGLLKADPKNRDAALKLSALLVAAGKNSDATAVLEQAVQESPQSPALSMALGEAYVNSGQYDRGITRMRTALQSVTDQSDFDPMMLNNAAYALAEHNTHLDAAREFAEKAVTALEDRSIQSSNTDNRLDLELAAVWDTLGWVYFQSGNANRAEVYVRPAWTLERHSLVGDHLGQIYEKLGRKQDAAHIYELALAAQASTTNSFPVSRMSSATPNPDQKGHDQIAQHYRNLTGHEYSGSEEAERLPNGEWKLPPDEELQESQVVKLSKTTELDGEAEFSLVFAAGKVESVRYRTGDDELKSLTRDLLNAHFPIEFPPGSRAKIVRRVSISCQPALGCDAVLLPSTAATRFGGN